jgi:hypothetical protein
MNADCGICEHKGDPANAPLFICLICADAIRRLVWLREREQQAEEARLATSQTAATTRERTAARSRP